MRSELKSSTILPHTKITGQHVLFATGDLPSTANSLIVSWWHSNDPPKRWSHVWEEGYCYRIPFQDCELWNGRYNGACLEVASDALVTEHAVAVLRRLAVCVVEHLLSTYPNDWLQSETGAVVYDCFSEQWAAKMLTTCWGEFSKDEGMLLATANLVDKDSGCSDGHMNIVAQIGWM